MCSSKLQQSLFDQPILLCMSRLMCYSPCAVFAIDELICFTFFGEDRIISKYLFVSNPAQFFVWYMETSSHDCTFFLNELTLQ